MTRLLPIASVLVFFTAMRGASTTATTVEHVRHLKTTQPKEAWPKMVYQSVAFNSPPSVSPHMHIYILCSKQFITSLLRQFNVRRFAWGTRQTAWYMESVEATVTWEVRPDQRTWFRGRPHRTWKCSCPRVRMNLHVWHSHWLTRLKGFSLQPRELSVLTSLVEEELSVSGLWHNITILWPSTSSLLHSASSIWLDTSIQWLSTISLRLSTSSLQQNSKKLRIGTSGLWLKG